MHNLQLTEDQDLIVDTVRKYVVDVVAPMALELDEHRTFGRNEFAGLAELGRVRPVRRRSRTGGVGMGLLPFVAALEAVGAHSSSLARLWIGQVQAALALEIAGAARSKRWSVVARSRRSSAPNTATAVRDGGIAGRAELVPGGMPAPTCCCSSSRPVRTAQPVLAVSGGPAPNAPR
jgi:hypothetical protein